MRSTLHLGALVAAVLLVAPLAQAEEPGALRKLGRGFANLTLGVLEIPRNIVEENRANGPLSAATVGVALGLARAPARTVLGAYEILSAPFALPEAYAPMISPEYAWQLSEAASRAARAAPGDAFLGSEAQAIGRIPGAVVVRRDGALAVLFPSDLLFAPGSWQLSPAARSRLSQLASALDENPDARLQVFGYADATGTDAYNLTLSAARAQAVRRAMVEAGIERERIDSVGYGSTSPIASNETDAGRQLNRRVEIEIRAGAVAAR
jgi:putative exosortase-associated protein (TIGR04073 family)